MKLGGGGGGGRAEWARGPAPQGSFQQRPPSASWLPLPPPRPPSAHLCGAGVASAGGSRAGGPCAPLLIVFSTQETSVRRQPGGCGPASGQQASFGSWPRLLVGAGRGSAVPGRTPLPWASLGPHGSPQCPAPPPPAPSSSSTRSGTCFSVLPRLTRVILGETERAWGEQAALPATPWLVAPRK